ncbi:MAG: hypothetical protein ABIR30_06555 [Chitinophagaceae bacterium]
MKKIILIITATFFSFAVSAQGNSGKKEKSKGNTSQPGTQGKSNGKDNTAQYSDHDRKVWEGIGDNSCFKVSKNQPAKVRSSFQRDYPFAVNVRWTKCRGDWTATFNNTLFRSTAVYHANGDRRDTRTPILRDNLPRRVLDEILKRLPGVNIDGAIKIEVPNIIKDIFRIKNTITGQQPFIYLDVDGSPVNYNY